MHHQTTTRIHIDPRTMGRTDAIYTDVMGGRRGTRIAFGIIALLGLLLTVIA